MKTNDDREASEEMAREKLQQQPKADKFSQNADEILPGLFLGSENAAMDPNFLHQHGITHILVPAFTGQKTLLHKDTIENVLADSSGGKVLVHCANGVSRSPAIVIAYIMKIMNFDANSAFQFVRKKRHKISNSKFGEQLILWGKLGYTLNVAADIDIVNGKEINSNTMVFEELRRKYNLKKQKKLAAAFSGELQTFWPAN